MQEANIQKISHHQIWQAFVQETVRQVSKGSEVDLELADGLCIEDLTGEVYTALGKDGII